MRKRKQKRKWKQKQKWKTKWKQKRKKNEFSFCFSFSFWFLLFKIFCIFVNSMWPRDAIDGQLSLDWPRSAISPRNMAPSLIRICRIQWCCSLYLFSSFFGKFGPKNQNYQLKLKFGTYTNLNMQNLMAMFTFFVFGRKYLFRTIGPKNQNCQLKVKLYT